MQSQSPVQAVKVKIPEGTCPVKPVPALANGDPHFANWLEPRKWPHAIHCTDDISLGL